MLLLALALSALHAGRQVFAEYRLLGGWLERPGGVSAAEVVALRRDIGARIIVRSTASAILLLCTLAMLWLQQRQLGMLRMLHHVKLLALDVLSSMDQGVITTDTRGDVTGVNSAATRILDVPSECVGRPLASLDSVGVSLVALARRGRQARRGGLGQGFRPGSGGPRAEDPRGCPRPQGHRGAVARLRDPPAWNVSDRVQMEERVRWMERFVSLGVLASGLHHEIKNPLTALSIHVQLLEKRLRDPASRRPVDELIGVLKTEMLRLNGVLDSFRDFASLHRLTVRPADVLDILEETVRLIGPQADQQHVEVTLRRPGEALPRVRSTTTSSSRRS